MPARREREILGVATVVFARKGYRQADVQVVADQAGVGKGTVYRYFPTKEKLFLAAVDAGMRELSARVDEAVQIESDPVLQMAGAVKAYLGFFDARPEVVELLIIERAEFREREKPTYFAHQEKNEGKWRLFLEDAMQSGHIRRMPPERILGVMSDALYGVIFTNHFAGRRASFEQQAEEIMDVLLRGILAPPTAQGRPPPQL